MKPGIERQAHKWSRQPYISSGLKRRAWGEGELATGVEVGEGGEDDEAVIEKLQDR